ncbi:uncharacterized protein LOC101241983 [Ciona intestinalis]
MYGKARLLLRHRYLIVLIYIICRLKYVTVYGATIGLTVVNENALVRNDVTSYLKCVTDDVELSHSAFSREQDTGSGTRMSSMTMVGPISPEEWPGKRLSMFADAGLHRTGVFSCQAKDPDTNILTKVTAIKQGTSGEIWPEKFTQTVNRGDENVELVFKSFDPTIDVIWRFSGHVIGASNQKLKKTIRRVTSRDAGIYECYKPPEDSSADLNEYWPLDQGIMRLIVRECPHGKWDPPDCERDCSCVNGGACDHVTGECVCPPGFNGENCENGCGGNRFGDKCQFHCKEGGSNHGDDAEECSGRHFCLTDPYGCSCAAGFSGLECNNGCVNGKYGADCLQECHCKRPDLCNRFTGSCTMGCGRGWKGSSCQTPCEPGTWGENCINQCNCFNGEPCDGTDGQCTSGRCKPPFTGSSCQVDSIDECESNPCQHGGTCNDKVFAYECKCINGTEGVNCETDYDECLEEPCLHGGECTDTGPASFRCHCESGYEGDRCEIDSDDCQGHKCVNGECVDKLRTYECKCNAGYEGRYCGSQCKIGTFFHEDFTACQLCPKHHYQDKEGQNFCTPCVQGSKTNFEGSKSQSDCVHLAANGMSLVVVTGVLVGILVVVVAGIGGWYYWNQKSKTRLEHLGPGRMVW